MPTDRVHRVRSSTIEATRELADHPAVIQHHAQLDAGRIDIGHYLFPTESVVQFDDVGSRFYVHLPLLGRMRSRHSGADVTATREVAAVYQPEAGPLVGRWTPGCRTLCVTIDAASVHAALANLTGDRPARRFGSNPRCPRGMVTPAPGSSS